MPNLHRYFVQELGKHYKRRLSKLQSHLYHFTVKKRYYEGMTPHFNQPT